MKKILLLLFLALSFSLSAQQHFIGIKGGLLSSNAKYYGDNYSYYRFITNHNSFSAGLTYDYISKYNFLLGIELNYNEKGFTNGLSQAGFEGEFYTYQLYSNYFSIPIKIGYQIGNKTFFNIYTGLIGSWLYEGELKGYYNGEELFKPLNAPYPYNGTKLEAAAFLEMGVGYKFDTGIRTYITYLYQHSFTNIPFYRASDDMYFYGMSVSVGVQYELFKK